MTTMRSPRWPWLAVALLALPAGSAAQQHHPSPVPEDDPRAVRAGEVAERMLAGDRTAVEAYLAEHGEPGWVAGGGPADALEPLMALVAERPYAIEGYLAGPDRSVLVVLMDEEREWLLVQVDMEPGPPFRVTGLARAQFGGGAAPQLAGRRADQISRPPTIVRRTGT